MMKTKATVLALAATAVLFAIQAQSDEPADAQSNAEPNVPTAVRELLDTVTQAYELRLTEYRDSRTGPSDVIRLNKERWDLQVSSLASEKRIEFTEAYLARAEQVEKIAKKNYHAGTGTLAEWLDAKAARLRASIELATTKSFN